jgi:hypothetical protein
MEIVNLQSSMTNYYAELLSNKRKHQHVAHKVSKIHLHTLKEDNRHVHSLLFMRLFTRPCTSTFDGITRAMPLSESAIFFSTRKQSGGYP